MKHVALALAGILVASVGIANAQSGDEAAIRNLPEQYAAAWNKKDAAAGASVYTDDAVFVTVTGEALKGRAAIRKDLEEQWAGQNKGTTFKATVDGVEMLGPNLAMFYGTTTVSGGSVPPGQGEGHYLAIAEKVGGEWKAKAVSAAVDPPPMGGPRP